MIYVTCLLILLTSSSLCLKKQSDDDLSSSITSSGDLPLYHAFGPNDNFKLRGVITFKNGKTPSLTNNNELTDDEMNKLHKLAIEDGLYFIKTPSKIGEVISDHENNTSFVLTYVKSCYLYGSGLQDSITVAVDYAGNVIGLNIASPKSTCIDVPEPNNVFNSMLYVQNQVAGAAPDTQTFIRKIEQEKADQDAGKGQDNRSFFAKYWMYIVPVVLVFMLSAQAEPAAEGAGGRSE